MAYRFRANSRVKYYINKITFPVTFRQSLSKLFGTPTVLDNKPVFTFYSLYVLSPPLPPPRSMLGLTPKRPDSSNFMANGNNIGKGARGMEMFPTLKGIRRSVPTVLKVIVCYRVC